MQQKPERTIVYIDGFNLYYGCLRKTEYKWLDLSRLFAQLLGSQHSITKIKYFTARISSRNGDNSSTQRQKAYLLALEKHVPNIHIYYGHYLSHPIMAKAYQPTQGQPPYVKVFKTEEKGDRKPPLTADGIFLVCPPSANQRLFSINKARTLAGSLQWHSAAACWGKTLRPQKTPERKNCSAIQPKLLSLWALPSIFTK